MNGTLRIPAALVPTARGEWRVAGAAARAAGLAAVFGAAGSVLAGMGLALQRACLGRIGLESLFLGFVAFWIGPLVVSLL